MRNMDHIELHRGGREEAFPETAEDWPYIAERAEFARYPGQFRPLALAFRSRAFLHGAGSN